MTEERKHESVFDIKIGPAFIAVIISAVISFAQYSYIQGEQKAIAEETKKTAEQLSMKVEKQDDRVHSVIERVVKVETIAGTIRDALASIDTKLDRIVRTGKLDNP